MNKIKVIDIINTPNAILHSFGLKVFDSISEYLSNNQEITVSFEGLKNVTSAFCNASIGKAYLSFPDASSLLKLHGIESHPIWIEKIEDAVYLASNPEQIELQNRAISDLLCS